MQVIVTEASKISRDISMSGKLIAPSTDVENMGRMPATTEGSVVLRSPSKSWKVIIELLSCFLTKSHP